ncbi:MAG: hypothetical protein OXC95_07775 [Dehalococcoidia bacterium]|nr:hypothetical protein [Dehalococcoidia bacterium]
MKIRDHIETAQSFLEAADREFAAGDHLQASEKLWGAASHAVMAAAQQHGWPYGSHRAMKTVARRLAEQYADPFLLGGFAFAEKFHANFYHDFMEDFDLEGDRPMVRDFVHRVTGLIPENGARPE